MFDFYTCFMFNMSGSCKNFWGENVLYLSYPIGPQKEVWPLPFPRASAMSSFYQM